MSAHVFLQSARAQVGHVNVNKAIPDIGTIKQSNNNNNNKEKRVAFQCGFNLDLDFALPQAQSTIN